MTKTFAITFKGTAGGTFNFVALDLAGKSVVMKSTDRITWKNAGIEIEFDAPLHVHLECGAIKGTTWDISVTEVGAAAACFTASGATGDQPGGTAINISVRDADSTC